MKRRPAFVDLASLRAGAGREMVALRREGLPLALRLAAGAMAIAGAVLLAGGARG